MEAKNIMAFVHLLEQLKCRTRHAYTSTMRPESVAEHCWRCAVLAYLLKEEFPEADMNRVILMALVHDFGEAITGDIPTFLKSSADEEAEDSAMRSMLTPLPDKLRQELLAIFDDIEQQETVESHILRAIDRLEAVIQHNESDLSTWIPLEWELNLTHGVSECENFPALAELREEARQESLLKKKKKEENP